MEHKNGACFIRTDINDKKYVLTNSVYGVNADTSVFKRVKELYVSLERYELESHQVVITTCTVSGDDRLKNRLFDAVVIDEASTLIEPEQMIAMVHTNKHVIVVGDRN